eukprot:355736-Chlamydomonas_euryale.AAC.9
MGRLTNRDSQSRETRLAGLGGQRVLGEGCASGVPMTPQAWRANCQWWIARARWHAAHAMGGSNMECVAH